MGRNPIDIVSIFVELNKKAPVFQGLFLIPDYAIEKFYLLLSLDE